MDRLRLAAIVLSVALHAGLIVGVKGATSHVSFDAGGGTDDFKVEKGIAIEGVGLFGQDRETVHAAEVAPQEMATPVQPAEPVKTEDKPEVITSTATEQPNAVAAKEPEPEIAKPQPEPPPPQQVAAVTPPPQQAIAMEQSAARAHSGGDAKMLSMYRGEISKKLQRSKVMPRSRASGLVVVRFEVGQTGALLSRQVEKSSGSRVLDDAAMAALDKAAPFPPIPPDTGKQSLVLSVPFEFIQR